MKGPTIWRLPCGKARRTSKPPMSWARGTMMSSSASQPRLSPGTGSLAGSQLMGRLQGSSFRYATRILGCTPSNSPPVEWASAGASPQFRDALSHRRMRAENHGRLARQLPAIAMRKRDLASLERPRAPFAANLARRFDQEEDAVHARVTVGEAPAIGVHGQVPTGRDGAARDEASALAFRAKAEILQKQDRV